VIQAFNVAFAFVSPPLFSNTVQGTGLGQRWTSDQRRFLSSRRVKAELLETPVDEVAKDKNNDSKANRKGKSKQGGKRKPSDENNTGQEKLSNLVKDKLGRELQEGDITYTVYAPDNGKTGEGYLAKVTFKCFKGKPSHVGEMQNSKKGAIKSAVEVALRDEVLQAAPTQKTIPAATTKKKTNKTANRKIPVAIADLEIGQELKGVVTGKNKGGVYLDVGAEARGYLRVREFQDEGFPRRPPNRGEKMSVRVLSKNETYVWFTKRSGDLERPPMVDHLRLTATSFEGLPTTAWFDAEVVDMAFSGVVLLVTHPEGGEPAAAFLDQVDFADSFREKAKLGIKVSVRKKMISHDGMNDRKFLFVSMKEERDWDSINVGDTVNGTVRGEGWGGDYVELGTNIDGFLPYEESTDGFPFKRPRRGDTVTARVLRKDNKTPSLKLTMKSGDLTRPTLVTFDSQVDLSPFTMRPADELFDGQVVRMRPPRSIMVAVQVPGTTAYTTGFLNTKEATDTFLKEVSVGMTTKVRIKNVTVQPRQLLLSMRELGSNSDGTQESNDEVVPTSESPQQPSTEVVAPEEVAEAEAPPKKGGQFMDVKDVLFR